MLTHDVSAKIPSDHLVEDFVDLRLQRRNILLAEVGSDTRLKHNIKISVARICEGRTPDLIVDHLVVAVILFEDTEERYNVRVLQGLLRYDMP